MEVIVIGGGMGGLTAAISLAKKGECVTLLEANERVGKKISQTGNGRCNILNADFDENKYNANETARKIIREYPQKVIDFLRETGLVLTEPDDCGRVYPITAAANSVVDCLRYAAASRGVKVITECRAEKLIDFPEKISVKTNKGYFTADRAIVAAGSCIAAKGYNGTELVGEKYFTKLCPSLVPVKVFDPYPQLNGVRLAAEVSLFRNKEKVFGERGEVLFKEYGLGGIVILNLSSVIARDIVAGIKADYTVSLDLFPNSTSAELKKTLLDRLGQFGGERVFLGLIHNKIAEAVLKRNKAKSVTKKNLGEISATLKNFIFKIDGLVDKSMAQVCAGGVDDKFLDGLRLKNTNIYLAGEILNVDGTSGGYNLYFACASGLFVAENMK